MINFNSVVSIIKLKRIIFEDNTRKQNLDNMVPIMILKSVVYRISQKLFKKKKNELENR